MKIVIATAVYYPQINGVAMFSHNLAVGLAKRGNEVMVICPSQTGKSYSRTVDGVKTMYLKSVEAKVYPDQIHSLPKQKKVLGVKMPRLLYKHGFRVSVFPQTAVKRILGKFQPDVVHVQVSDPIGLSVVGWARKAGVPVVTTEHNQPEVLTEPLKMPGIVRRPVNALLYVYFRNRQNKSDFVTMPTEQAIRNLLSRGDIGVPIAAVSNGVDLSHYAPGVPKETIYHKYGIVKDVPTVLYVGRVDPEKKVGVVIEAFKQARKVLPNIQMVVVGDGVDKVRLEKLVGKDELPVRFAGRVVGDDLYELYRVGTLFATASPIETQGIVLIEAAASGLPLIAVNAGAVEEVCQNGVNGYLCKVGDINGIAEAMCKILSDTKLQAKFAKASEEIAHEHDFEKTLDKFINIYNRVIDRKIDKRQ